jgi:hypothetical protein
MIRVKAAFFSLTPPPEAGEDISGYLRWHALDHMPEQYQLPGLVYATRWLADQECLDNRVTGEGRLERIGSIMNYLIGEPVQQTHDDFMELGPRLAELGRYPEARPSLQLRLLALLRWYAAPQALVSPEVVPFRPHRGVVVVIEEPGNATPGGWLSGCRPSITPRCWKLREWPGRGCTGRRTRGGYIRTATVTLSTAL